MRIGLVNEGTYPVVTGGVSTWCHQLVTGLPEHEWHLLTITAGQAAPVWDLPEQVASCTFSHMWAPVRPLPVTRLVRTGRRRAAVAEALDGFWSAALPAGAPAGDGPATPTVAGATAPLLAALDVLAEPHPVPLGAILGADGSTPAVLRAWRAHRHHRPDLPRLSVAGAAQVAALVDRALALVDVEWPDVDVVHTASNGPAALLSVARARRQQVPLILTEHGVYLRERYLALGELGMSWPVRYAVLAALRAMCHLAYDQADLILPVSDFNARWERELGAHPSRTRTIHNGVDEQRYTALGQEPELPTISFVGRIDPLKDLETLVSAFALVRAEVPDARLRLFGPCPAGNEAYRDRVVALADQLGVSDAIGWEGPVDGAVPAIAAGNVVALSSISEGLPFTVIEAMLCGRATVSTDVGGVSEIVGRDGRCGGLVPPRRPEALAAELVDLLQDHERRARVAEAGRRRALERFTLDRCIGSYREAYASVATTSDALVLDLTDRATADAGGRPDHEAPATVTVPPGAGRPSTDTDDRAATVADARLAKAG